MKQIQTWKVGRLSITSIPEFERLPLSGMVPEATGDRIDDLRPYLEPHFLDGQVEGQLIAAIQSFVVESGDTKILVDTCYGNDKKRTYPMFNQLHGPFLQDFRRAGFRPEDVDIVLCTHLHSDHVGWNTRLVNGEWVPTFPNARYLIGNDELVHARLQQDAEARERLRDSVDPLFERDLVDLVGVDHRLNDDVSLMPTPGHTPGHVSVRVASQGSEAIISGDIMITPAQILEPTWCARNDLDTDEAIRSRNRALRHCLDTGGLFIGTHFPAPTAVRIGAGEGTGRFVPIVEG
jgi:glyoxylase-like metal-dependent hydrolase (beta-lactamase superfamily II)